MQSRSRIRTVVPALRPAFAMSGTIMLLFVLLVIVLVVRSYFLWTAIPANPPPSGAAPFGHQANYDSAYRIGVVIAKVVLWAGPIIIPLIVLAIAWLVGWVVSLMFGKSDDAGNIGSGVIMCGALALFGYGAYAAATAPAPAPAPAGMLAGPSPADNSGVGRGSPNAAQQLSERSQQQMRDMAERSRQQIEAMRESQLRQLDALRNGQPPPAPTPSPAGRSPAQSRPTTVPATPKENPAIRPVVDAFTSDMNGKIDALIGQANKLLPDLARMPAHDLTRIKARVADTDALQVAAEALKKSLDTASDELTVKIEAAGVSSNDAHSAAFQWSGFDFGVARRGFAADSLIRLCKTSKEECEFLRDNFGKWTLDSKGEVKSTDIQIKQQAGSKRFFVKAEADRKDSILDQLRGK